MLNRLFLVTLLPSITILAGCATTTTQHTVQKSAHSALDSVEQYIQAAIRYDSMNAVAALDPGLVASRGGSQTVRSLLEAQYKVTERLSGSPRLVEIGKPDVINEGAQLFAWVPVRISKDGFPSTSISEINYASISRDGGNTWYAIDLWCTDLKWIETNFPGYLLSAYKVSFSPTGRSFSP